MEGTGDDGWTASWNGAGEILTGKEDARNDHEGSAWIRFSPPLFTLTLAFLYFLRLIARRKHFLLLTVFYLIFFFPSERDWNSERGAFGFSVSRDSQSPNERTCGATLRWLFSCPSRHKFFLPLRTGREKWNVNHNSLRKRSIYLNERSSSLRSKIKITPRSVGRTSSEERSRVDGGCENGRTLRRRAATSAESWGITLS